MSDESQGKSLTAGEAGKGDIEQFKPRFSLGQLLGTPGAIEAIREAGQEGQGLLIRHQSGDWGDLQEEDQAENEFSVDNELRILSAYTLNNGVKVWVITEADRSATTILLPDEY